jgi:hypothetical protein
MWRVGDLSVTAPASLSSTIFISFKSYPLPRPKAILL